MSRPCCGGDVLCACAHMRINGIYSVDNALCILMLVRAFMHAFVTPQITSMHLYAAWACPCVYPHVKPWLGHPCTKHARLGLPSQPIMPAEAEACVICLDLRP
eukprot:356454-Chlamydomonas_euryale.AAC.5